MISLTTFPISYGPDGPFYDIQVRHILQSGVPDSDDAPLVYYYLAPFVVLTTFFSGDPYIGSFLGIKIGMALISSLMAIPTFFLTETFTKKVNIESKIPAFLSAILITLNVYVFRMVEDFMQNLAGIFFVLCYLYFSVRWFEDIRKWRKYGVLSILSLVCAIFTHVYTAGLVIVLFPALYFFNLIFRWFKTRSIPKLELIILLLLIVVGLAGFFILINFFPDAQLERILNFASSLLSLSSSSKFPVLQAILVFVTFPFIVGLLAILHYLYNGLKKKARMEDNTIRKETFLAFQYLTLFVLLIVLILLPTKWVDRFLLLAFLPLGLIIPLGIKYVDQFLLKKYKSDRTNMRKGIIAFLAIFCVISNMITTISIFPKMGPFISENEYTGLREIRSKFIENGSVDQTGVIFIPDYHLGYWVEFILEMEYFTGDVNANSAEFLGRPIYGIFFRDLNDPFDSQYNYQWFPLLPYGIPRIKQSGPPELVPGVKIYVSDALVLTLLYSANGTRMF